MMSPKKSVPKDTAGESQTPSYRLLFGENNPPAAETDRLCDEVLLSLVEGVGSLTITRLLECFGTAKDILGAKRELLLTVPGIGDKTADQILSVRSRHDPEKLIERCRQEGIAILTRDDPRYPRSLLEIADPPFILYAMGERLPQDDLAVAVVGTRGCSLYGRRQTETLVRGLTCAGVTIVSGLALGIDGVAHEAALRAGGRTIAVLGSGLLNIYPACHKQLAERIAKQGVLYSEFPPLTTPIAGNFPRRNRIVSGLTLGVLVVETARRGGSLITARLAMEQNREVFAVPGPIDSESSRGCHLLIKDGAKLVETPGDILDELGPLPCQPQADVSSAPEDQTTPSSQRRAAELSLDDSHQKILSLITTTPVLIDDIISQSEMSASKVMMILGALELKRIILRTEGGKVARR